MYFNRPYFFLIMAGLLLAIGCDSTTLVHGAIGLPNKVEESSGLAHFNQDLITFNDSGGKATLYQINLEGTIVKKHKIKGAVNRDWEDIAQDDNHYYIADTGNNYATRKDLTIYITSKNFVLKDSILIRYAEQTKFKKKKKNKYDAETLIVVEDSLVIFSKNRKSRKTQVYVFPKEPGNYILKKRKTFEVNALITGGDYEPTHRKLVLTGYLPDRTQYLFKGEDFRLDSLENLKLKRYALPLKNAQVEAVCFHTDGNIWISSEGEGSHQAFLLPIDFDLLESTKKEWSYE